MPSLRSLASSARFLLNHPLTREHRAEALARVLRWQLTSRLHPAGVEVPFVNHTRLLARRGMTGATGNIYVGLAELEEMAFVGHALREGDLFVDVGANIGSFSVLASGACGARSVCFEPVPSTFAHLLDNLRLNDLLGLVEAHNKGVGAQDGTLRFSNDSDTINHVLRDASEGIEVPVCTLDGVLAGRAPTVLKVDTEGFESFVIDGAERVLREPSLLAVELELGGAGALYGRNEDSLRERLLSAGFEMVRYDPLSRSLRREATAAQNTLFVRRFEEVAERLRTAPPLLVLGRAL